MHALPDELLVVILAEHVALPDLASCPLVCRRWRRMFRSRALRRYHNAHYVSLQSHNRPMDNDLLSYVDLDIRNAQGETPLHAAAAIGSVANADLLLSRIDSEIQLSEKMRRYIDNADGRGNTPLLVAVAKANLGVAKRLLDRGANVNAHEARGRTPIHKAVEIGNVEMVRMLISYGAHLDVIDCFQMTPLHIAACSKRQSSCHEATTRDHPSSIEIVRVLLDKGSDPAALDIHGQTPLHLASLWGSEIFEIILNSAIWKCCYKPLRRSISLSWLTPSSSVNSTASISPQFDMLRSDLDVQEEAADHPVSLRDWAGHTPLHRAAQLGNLVAVTAILRHTAVDSPTLPRNTRPVDINAVTEDKRRTALHHACAAGNLECVRALIAAGSDLNLEDADQWTPLDHAKGRRDGTDCVRELVRAGAKRGLPFWALPVSGYRSLLGGERSRNRAERA